jgi:hypothetical protein
MDKLSQLIRAFDKYKMRHINVLNHQDKNNRHTQLYNEIVKGKVTTDEEAVNFLYGKSNDKALPPKYRTFKTEFKERTVNSMMLINADHEDFDDYQRAVYAANREWLIIRAAARHGLNDVSLYFAEGLLETLMKYEYTDLIVQVLDLLKTNTARKGDKKKFAEYQALSEHYNGQWLAEQKAKDYSNLLKMEFVKKAEYKDVSAIARAYFEELKPLMEKYDSIALRLNATIVEIYIYSSVNDYENLLDVAERGIKYFTEKEFMVKVALSVFLEQQMIALMMLKRYDEAYEAINASLELRQKGTFNWFKGQESKVALCFRTHRYTEGYAIYKEVMAIPEFNKVLTGMNKEMWFVFNAYFHLLHKLGVAPDLVLDGKAFNFKEFIKTVPTFEQDKKGMHLALVILEICFMMSKQERDVLIDRIEALQKHLSRYSSKTDPSYRFNQFGNMLLEIPKSGFMRSVLEKNTAQLFKDLQSVPYDMVESIYRSEVVELEELWILMLNNYAKLK